MSIDTESLRQELQAGDAKTAQLYNALALLRENQVGQSTRITVLDALLLGPSEFEARIQQEQLWCEQTKDNVSVIEVAFDEALSVEEEARFAQQLLELASNPGDFVGVTSDRAYAVAMASVNDREAQRLTDMAIGMAQYAAPARDFRCGYQCLDSTAPRRPIEMRTAPNRSGCAVAAQTAGRAW